MKSPMHNQITKKTNLATLMAERISAGLRRKSITKPSQWACAYREMQKGRWNFKYHPWLKEMHDSDSQFNIGMKAAQMGFTETVLNLAFFTIDVKGQDCLYVLPSKTPDASDFSAARFDAALELSDHLRKLFSDVRNVGHKRAGAANLYIRGSQSRAGLKSIPVSTIILDELAEMVAENIPLALERTSGQEESDKLVWMISTPTIQSKNIDGFFKESTQEEYFFKCPSCTRYTLLSFPECLEITAEDFSDPRINESFLKCKECKNKLHHETKCDWLSNDNAKWIPQFSDKNNRGFTISQLYSTRLHPSTVAISFLKGKSNPADETEFHNSKLGKTHAVEGARVTDVQIDECIREGQHKSTDPVVNGGLITMGIDIGKRIHYEIDRWYLKGQPGPDANINAVGKLIKFGHVKQFEELDQLMIQNRVLFAVVDANPERRKAFEFASRFYGRVKMCFYGRGISGKQINITKDQSEPAITVDRTSWLDLSLGRFRTKTIHLPIDIDLEYREHIKALVRIYGKDKDGNPVGSYDKADSDQDHYAHARNYSEIALTLALAMGESRDIGSVV